MKLFTKYTRINLLVMVIVFLLSAASTYLLTNYVLIREMDADLSGIHHRIVDYYTQYHQLPAGHVLDEEQVTYEPVPAGQEMKGDEFTLVTRYSQREQKMHNFRQIVFTFQAGDRLYKVTIAKPLEGLHHLSAPSCWYPLPRSSSPSWLFS
jgi:hypothetical protein